MQRVVFIAVVIVFVFVALGALVPQTRQALLDGIGQVIDALTRDAGSSGV